MGWQQPKVINFRINTYGIASERVVLVCGEDFVLLPGEANPVVKTLAKNAITTSAIHSQMLHDEPRLFMMHFWAVDDPLKLAKELKAAFDKTNAKH